MGLCSDAFSVLDAPGNCAICLHSETKKDVQYKLGYINGLNIKYIICIKAYNI